MPSLLAASLDLRLPFCNSAFGFQRRCVGCCSRPPARALPAGWQRPPLQPLPPPSARQVVTAASEDPNQGPSAPSAPAPLRAPDTPPAPSSGSSPAPSAPAAPEGGGGGGEGPGGPRLDVDNEGNVRLPKEVIDRLKSAVFGFDTFWVTSVDDYGHEGAVFRGNVRGRDPARAYGKMRERLQTAFSGAYELFLLEDKEEKPTVVVLPTGAGLDTKISKFTEVWLACLFAGATAVTSFNAAGVPLLDFVAAPGATSITQQDFLDALPGVLAFWVALGAHDWGHAQAARRHGLQLYLPFYLPAGFGLLGSFGSITRLRNWVPDRTALLDFSLSGPLWGCGAAGAMMLAGFGLTAAGVTTTAVDTAAFADSCLVGLLAGGLLGPERLAQPVTEVHFLLLSGWSALLASCLALIPAGELDGARVVLAGWGRRAASAVGLVTTGALGLSAVSGNALSFYWLLLVLFLQRGPIPPCCEELSPPRSPTPTTSTPTSTPTSPAPSSTPSSAPLPSSSPSPAPSPAPPPAYATRSSALLLLGLSLAVLVPLPLELLEAAAQFRDSGFIVPQSFPTDLL